MSLSAVKRKANEHSYPDTRAPARVTRARAFVSLLGNCEGLSHQEAHTITVGVLVRYGVVKILGNGKAGLNSREAAQFRYLLPESKSAEEDGDEIPVSGPL